MQALGEEGPTRGALWDRGSEHTMMPHQQEKHRHQGSATSWPGQAEPLPTTCFSYSHSSRLFKQNQTLSNTVPAIGVQNALVPAGKAHQQAYSQGTHLLWVYKRELPVQETGRLCP